MTKEGMSCVHGRLVMELVMTTQCRFEASQRARTSKRGRRRGEDGMVECSVAHAD